MSAAGNHTFKLVVNDTTCRQCGRCLAGDVCRGSAFIRYQRDESPFIDMSRCWGCLKCVVVCPFSAIVRLDYSQLSPAIP